MMIGLSRRVGALRTDRGVTLVEMLVAIMIFGILLTVVSSLYTSALRTVSLSRGLTENTKAASNVMNAISRSIRAGTENPVAGQTPPTDPAFVTAKDDEFVIYAYVNLSSAAQKPIMIRYRIDRTTGSLIETVWPATLLASGKWKFPLVTSTPTYSRVIAQTIAPYISGQDHPFTYLNKIGQPVAVSVPVGGLSSGDMRLVTAVKITISVQGSLTDAANKVTLINTVGIPNLGYAEDTPL